MTYAEKLKDPRWQKKRLEILQRDGFKCMVCKDDKSTLNIHHKMYLKDTDPWNYSPQLLITLCEDCHKSEESNKQHIKMDLQLLYSLGYNNDTLHELYGYIEYTLSAYKITPSQINSIISSALSHYARTGGQDG